jgi:hypothetical protein
MPPGINVVVDGFDIYYRHRGLFILSISGRYETPDDISWVNANSKSSKTYIWRCGIYVVHMKTESCRLTLFASIRATKMHWIKSWKYHFIFSYAWLTQYPKSYLPFPLLPSSFLSISLSKQKLPELKAKLSPPHKPYGHHQPRLYNSPDRPSSSASRR